MTELKRLIIGLIIVLSVIMCSSVTVFAFSQEFNYSNSPEFNLVKASVEGNILHVSVKNVLNKSKCLIQVAEEQSVVTSRDGVFYGTISLNKIPKGSYDVQLFLDTEVENHFSSFLSRQITITYSNGSWGFPDKANTNTNLSISKRKSSNTVTMLPVTPFVKDASNQIVVNCKSDIEKVAGIYYWLSNNVSYDIKNMYHGSYHVPDDVLTYKHAVCYGYATTFQALCNAQNIPCVIYTGWAYGADGTTERHAWNEVYINGNWHFIDVTADAKGKYNGSTVVIDEAKRVDFNYFMPSIKDISDTYLYEDIYTDFDYLAYLDKSKGYSSWAKGEIVNASYLSLLNNTVSLPNNFTQPITRGQFCDLLVNYIMIQLSEERLFNLSSDGVLNVMNSSISSVRHGFVSEQYQLTPAILFCYANNIVYGKSNSYFGINDYITREEAATMLYRTMQYLGSINRNFKYSNQTNIRFADDYNVSSWAKDSVSIVNSMYVMQGIGNDCFDPKNYYTIEQSVATMYRLFRYNFSRS